MCLNHDGRGGGKHTGEQGFFMAGQFANDAIGGRVFSGLLVGFSERGQRIDRNPNTDATGFALLGMVFIDQILTGGLNLVSSNKAQFKALGTVQTSEGVIRPMHKNGLKINTVKEHLLKHLGSALP